MKITKISTPQTLLSTLYAPCAPPTSSCNIYAYLKYVLLNTLQEHFYHVLENQRAKQKPTVVIAAEYEMPEYTPPIYQEVGELLVKKRLS